MLLFLLKGDEILTGSWRPENQLQIWDYGTGKLIQGNKFILNNVEKNEIILMREVALPGINISRNFIRKSIYPPSSFPSFKLHKKITIRFSSRILRF